MLLRACKKYSCCTYNIWNNPPQHAWIPHSRSIQVELGKMEGFSSILQTARASTSHTFECWVATLLAHYTFKGENQSAVPCDNDVIRSDWRRPIRLHHLDFHGRILCVLMFMLVCSPRSVCHRAPSKCGARCDHTSCTAQRTALYVCIYIYIYI